MRKLSPEKRRDFLEVSIKKKKKAKNEIGHSWVQAWDPSFYGLPKYL